jgi:SnoaL-like domain
VTLNPVSGHRPESSAFTAPQELHDLAFRYALAVDNCDARMLISTFAVDGAVVGYGENPIEFRAELGLREMIRLVGSGFQRTLHKVFNQTFERDAAGQVTGITYCTASHILPGSDWNLLDMTIRYHNVLTQEADGWKYRERRLEVIWVETRPVQKFTAAMMDADLKEFK